MGFLHPSKKCTIVRNKEPIAWVYLSNLLYHSTGSLWLMVLKIGGVISMCSPSFSWHLKSWSKQWHSCLQKVNIIADSEIFGWAYWLER
uniref:Uncharacterized protein n=1 Tax=Kalanchoe fedtschenkoi TaxID=63787 RepID=A0A7N0V3T6_KALFE